VHPRRRTLRRTLGLGVLAMLVLLVSSACGGREKDAKARPLPEKQQTLSPGLYRSEEFEPSLSFRVGNGWTNEPPESSEYLSLLRGVMGGVYFFRLKEVYEPARMGMPNVVEVSKDPRACYELGRKSHRNADSKVGLVPSRSPFPAFLSHF
jgi:hypothetical protein